MRSGFNILAACLVFTGLALMPSVGLAQGPESTNVDELWLPSFSLFGGAMLQDQSSSVEAQCAQGRPEETVIFIINGQERTQKRPACRDPSGILDPQPVTETVGNLRPPQDDDEFAVTPMVGASLQLMTPRIDWVPFGPRFFVAGEVLTFWPPERQIAREGVPQGVDFPPPTSPSEEANAARTTANALFGLGSVTQSEVQTLGFGAQLGMAFPFEFRERRLWLKPAIGWTRFEVDVEGRVEAALKDDGFGIALTPQGNFQLDLRKGPGIRKISLSGGKDGTFDGIGPGLELELEVGRYGPFGVSVFGGAQAFRVIGDRSIEFSDSLTCDPDSSPCPSGLVNQGTFVIVNNQPLTIGPEDVVSPAGPVPIPGTLLTEEPFAPFGPDTYTANWSFEVDEWGYRGGVGIRIHWLGN